MMLCMMVHYDAGGYSDFIDMGKFGDDLSFVSVSLNFNFNLNTFKIIKT